MDIKELLNYEKSLYKHDVLLSKSFFIAAIKNEPQYKIWRWQRLSRLTDFYRTRMRLEPSYFRYLYGILYLIFIRRKQLLGEKLGIEITTERIGKGLIVYHYNNVINACAVIGENCHLHGTNVIGNAGPDDPEGCPIIGNNVMLGAGAKVIGRVTIADNIKIAAGAVVVHSFTESGITIAGIPARKVSK